MKNKAKLLRYFKENKNNAYCDDCLSEMLNITPRQATNQLCRNLYKNNIISRNKGLCSICLKDFKLINKINSNMEDSKINHSKSPYQNRNLNQGGFTLNEENIRDEIFNRLHHHLFQLRGIKLQKEGPLSYNLPNGAVINHKNDILIEKSESQKYVAIEVKFRSSVTDQFKCRSYDMIHLKQQYNDRLLGVMIYVRADKGLSIKGAKDLCYMFDSFLGVRYEDFYESKVLNQLIDQVLDFLLEK